MILFDSYMALFQGAFTGFIFGFLLQKGRVSKFNVIVSQLLLKDFTVLRIMLKAIIVGGLGAYTMLYFGLVSDLNIGNTFVLKNIVGGTIFGIGMATLGFCPGTAIAAAGEGAKDAMWGIGGMFFGSALFAELYPWLRLNLLDKGPLGEVTLADITGLSPFIIFLLLAAILYFGNPWLQKYKKPVK